MSDEATEKEPRFERLVTLLPALEARAGSGVTFDRYGSPPRFDGVAESLYTIAHDENCIVVGFNWPEQMHSLRAYVEPDRVEGADLDICRKLLTIIVRQERFVEGSLSEHIESGFAARLVRRLGVLARLLPPEGMIDVATDMLAEEEQREELEHLRALLGGQLSQVRLLVKELRDARNPEQRQDALGAFPTCLAQLEFAANRLLKRLSLEPLKKETEDD